MGSHCCLRYRMKRGTLLYSCYLQIWQMSFQLFSSLSSVRYAPVNAAFSGTTVSIIKRPEGSLMNPSRVGFEGYRKKAYDYNMLHF